MRDNLLKGKNFHCSIDFKKKQTEKDYKRLVTHNIKNWTDSAKYEQFNIK